MCLQSDYSENYMFDCLWYIHSGYWNGVRHTLTHTLMVLFFTQNMLSFQPKLYCISGYLCGPEIYVVWIQKSTYAVAIGAGRGVQP